MLSPLIVIAAVVTDFFLGEPKKYHPLVGFGRLVTLYESRFNKQGNAFKQVLIGAVGVLFLVTPFVLFTISIHSFLPWAWCFDVFVLYMAIGNKSLREHILLVREALTQQSLSEARTRVSMIVSRDTESLDESQLIKASVETGLENGSDAVFAPIFWFCLLGAPAVVAYRLVNTLDAMWGYRTDRYEYFGKFAARCDDVFNFIPARLVALSYALLGNTRLALRCWRDQAASLKSPNAGPVMVSGAGSLDVQLGGPTYYHGELVDKPYFGSQKEVQLADIKRSLDLIFHTLVLWIICITVLSLFLRLAL